MIETGGASYHQRVVARKVKTPPPPKRAVQAPSARTEQRDEGRRRKLIYVVAGSGLVMLAAVVGFFALAGGGSGGDSGGQQNALATIRAAGWTYQKAKDQGRNHMEQLPPGFQRNTVPGTSGPHSNQTAVYGIYTEQVPEINLVHNLEHGAVEIQYGPRVPQSSIDEITSFYNEDPSGLVVAPNPSLGDQIALTSWTNIAKGKRFDRKVFDAFLDGFGFKGPESCKSSVDQGCFRRSNMPPGSQ